MDFDCSSGDHCSAAAGIVAGETVHLFLDTSHCSSNHCDRSWNIDILDGMWQLNIERLSTK